MAATSCLVSHNGCPYSVGLERVVVRINEMNARFVLPRHNEIRESLFRPIVDAAAPESEPLSAVVRAHEEGPALPEH